MKACKFIVFVSAALLIWSCTKPEPQKPYTPPQPPVNPTPVEEPVKYELKDISEMTLHEKIGQMFFLRLEALKDLTDDQIGQYTTTYAGTAITEKMKEVFAAYPVGGFTIFAHNVVNPSQLTKMDKDIHDLGNYPLISIDEEGGRVTRIAKNTLFQVKNVGTMLSIGNTGNKQNAFNAGSYIGTYLSKYDIDIDLAPVADVFSNPKNTVIGDRSFSSSPNVAAEMSSAYLGGLKSVNVEGCLKHFPGHGDTSDDSHYVGVKTEKTWEQMLSCEMIPFKKCIESGARIIMTAHICTPNVTPLDLKPASLNYEILTGKLRGELGYEGLIVTDGIEMGAISSEYGIPEASVMAIQAGVDVVLIPMRYKKCIDAVEEAVSKGIITEARINESVERILKLKKDILQSRDRLKTAE